MLSFLLIFYTLLLGLGSAQAEEGNVPVVDFSILPSTAMVAKSDRSGNPHPVVARMLLDVEQVQVGVPFRLGVHLTMQKEWHTYWRSPGAVGKKTEILWNGPKNTTFSSYVFPIPHRYFDGASVSYGYSDQVLLYTDVVLPEGLSGEVELSAEVDWLVCKTSCIMGKADLKIPVSVGQETKPSSFVSLFNHFQAQHPTPLSKIQGIDVEYSLSVDKLHSEESFVFTSSIKAKEGVSLSVSTEEGQATWPYASPILEGNFDTQYDEAGIIPQILLTQSSEGALFIRIPAQTFSLYDDDPLPEHDAIGVLLNLNINGSEVWTEVVSPVSWERGKAKPSSESELIQKAAAAPVFIPNVRPAQQVDDHQNETTSAAEEAKNIASDSGISSTQVQESQSLWLMLGFAFVGGLILNVMPCVLPVLLFKIHSLLDQQQQTDANRRLSGLVYTAGVIISFLAFGFVVIFGQELLGHEVRWGFQNQSPVFTIVLSTICFLFGLSLFGVFEVPALGANKMDEASGKEGLLGYFLTGIFTTLIATPCSAPFLGTGMAFAFELPPLGVLSFFMVAGLGLASPFLLAAFVPSFKSFFPQPGPWMEKFKQFLGFTLVGTTVWLITGLPALVGIDGVLGFLSFLVVVSLGAWIQGSFGNATTSSTRQFSVLGSVLAMYAVGGWYFLTLSNAEANTNTTLQQDKLIYQWQIDGKTVQQGASSELNLLVLPQGAKTLSVQLFNELDFSHEIPWQPFSEEGIDQLVGTEYTIFIDFTAEWCASCKVNEKTILDTQHVRDAMKKYTVWPMKADNTNYSPLIDRWLKHFKSAGVPLYLVIPAKRVKGFDNYSSSVINLGEFITPAKVVEALEKASQ